VFVVVSQCSDRVTKNAKESRVCVSLARGGGRLRVNRTRERHEHLVRVVGWIGPEERLNQLAQGAC
jgi:hypothetical protein